MIETEVAGATSIWAVIRASSIFSLDWPILAPAYQPESPATADGLLITAHPIRPSVPAVLAILFMFFSWSDGELGNKDRQKVSVSFYASSVGDSNCRVHFFCASFRSRPYRSRGSR